MHLKKIFARKRKSVMSSLPHEPYGLWKSPITPRTLSLGKRFSDVQWDTDGQTLVWLESSSEGRVLVCASLNSADAPRDLTVGQSVRALVGYGGGDFTVAGGTLYFVEKSGCLYRQNLQTGPAEPLTPQFGHAASPVVSPDQRWVVYVHSHEKQDVLAVVDTAGRQWPQRITLGHDFYMQPCWHPAGTSLAFIAWDHPQMPWDGTTLFLASLHTSATGLIIRETTPIAGGKDIAIFQPAFSPDGRWLAYVSDEDGWSHIYLYDVQKGTHHRLTGGEAEHGIPAWIQGMRTYGWSADSQSIIFMRNEHGFATLMQQAVQGGEAVAVAGLEAYSWFEQPAISPTSSTLAVIASSSTQTPRLLTCPTTTADSGKTRIHARSTGEQIAATELAEAEPVSWASEDGSLVHGMLYLPPGVRMQDGTDGSRGLPPAIIKIHGGPTGQAVASFPQDVQYFATRGYVVLLVNYRGSTGYGRNYMLQMRGNWGVCDVEDAISGARYLSEQGIASTEKIVILGGSSGGYTVLEALCRAPGVFKAGISLFGISNLLALAADTHKFEERYLDTLLGPLPAASDIYRTRSPLFHADLLRDPLAVFQGTEDKVVPRNQSDMLVETLRKRGIPHVYHVYEGEGHGWRSPETIEAYYQAVEAFLQEHVLFA